MNVMNLMGERGGYELNVMSDRWGLLETHIVLGFSGVNH